MARKRDSNDDILKRLREIELKLTNGSDVQSACRGVGISDATYYHRRKRFGGMGRSQLSELRSLEKKNARLKKIVAELEVDKLILKESLSHLKPRACDGSVKVWVRGSVSFGLTSHCFYPIVIIDMQTDFCGEGGYVDAMGCDLSLTRAPIEPAEDIVLIAVNAAHMLGLPLNGQFVELGGSFVREDRIAPYYRLYSLEDFSPIRPGMMRVTDPASGSSIALDIWALPTSSVGDLLMQITAPLGLGTLELESGDTVTGFICEAAAAASAKDITAHGGWRTYLTTLCYYICGALNILTLFLTLEAVRGTIAIPVERIAVSIEKAGKPG